MSIFSQEMELALSGELQDYLDEADHNVMDAARQALHNIVTVGKKRLRDQVVGAGLAKAGAGDGRGSGRSLASAIRFELYPANGVARNPAGLLYVQPSAVKIFEAFENDTVIRAGNGKFLVIPIPGSPASREEFGDSPSGESVLQRLKSRGIEIAFVKATPSRPAMIVAENVRLRTNPKGRLKVGKAAKTKAGNYASGVGSVPLFFLVPRVRIAKRLSLNREFDRLAVEFVDMFTRELAAVLARYESGEQEASFLSARNRRPTRRR